MTKKTSYLIFLVFVLFTGTKYIGSMEKEKEDKEDNEIVNTLLKVSTRLKINTNLPVDIANLIVAFAKKDAKKNEVEKKPLLYFDSPCGAGSRVNSVLTSNNECNLPTESSLVNNPWFYSYSPSGL